MSALGRRDFSNYHLSSLGKFNISIYSCTKSSISGRNPPGTTGTFSLFLSGSQYASQVLDSVHCSEKQCDDGNISAMWGTGDVVFFRQFVHMLDDSTQTYLFSTFFANVLYMA